MNFIVSTFPIFCHLILALWRSSANPEHPRATTFRMSIILYVFRAFTLLLFACSASYRVQTRERWKKTATHLVIYEIGGGLMGLIIFGALIWLLVVHIT